MIESGGTIRQRTYSFRARLYGTLMLSLGTGRIKPSGTGLSFLISEFFIMNCLMSLATVPALKFTCNSGIPKKYAASPACEWKLRLASYSSLWV